MVANSGECRRLARQAPSPERVEAEKVNPVHRSAMRLSKDALHCCVGFRDLLGGFEVGAREADPARVRGEHVSCDQQFEPAPPQTPRVLQIVAAQFEVGVEANGGLLGRVR